MGGWVQVNVSCRTETSAYTALSLAANDTTGSEAWVKYDMHGENFAMKFKLVETD